MSQIIAVMGESGSGKTTSMEKLPSEETFYIDADGKGLAWVGWQNQYERGKNYVKMSQKEKVLAQIQNIDKTHSQFKYLVIDTINGIMVDEEMARIKEKGYEKWTELALGVYDIIKYALSARDDLTVIFVAHSQTEQDDNGYMFTRIKTNGRKLEKIVLESKFPNVVLAKAVDGKYVFEVHANNSTAKTLKGAFSQATMTIENDITKVIDAISGNNKTEEDNNDAKA